MNYRSLIYILFAFLLLSSACGTSSKTIKSQPSTQAFKWYTLSTSSTKANLAKEFNIRIQEIDALNPQIKNPIKAGERIKLPLHAIINTPSNSLQTDTVKIPVDIDSFEKFPLDLIPPRAFNIALLLPFNLDATSTVSADGYVTLDPVSQLCVDFYQGVLLALDTLKLNGLSVNLKVYDTFTDSLSITQFLKDSSMKSMDMVIGPAYNANLNIVADFCQENSIHFISPMSSSPAVTIDHSFAFQIIPTAANQVKLFCEYFLKKNKHASFLILHTDSKLEKELANIFRDCLNGEDSIYSPQVSEYAKTSLKSSEIVSRLKFSSKNIIIIPSSDQAFVASTLAKLVDLQNKYEITVLGLPTWENFETFDLRKLDLLDVHYFTTNFVDFKEPNLIPIRQKFMSRFKTDPSVAAIQGYDIMLVFGSALLKFGRDFKEFDFSIGQKFNHNGLSLKKYSPKDGFENMSIKIISFDNLTLKSQIFPSAK